MSSVVTQYQVMYDSLAARRRRPRLAKGLDVLPAMARVRLAHRQCSLARLRAEALAVDAISPEIRGFSEAALDHEIARVREVFLRGRQDTLVLRRSLAIVREVARRQTGEEAFIVQLMAALALFHGNIVEMLTGEGKTLTGSLVAPLLAWKHRHVHVFTVNDYLATRDAESRSRVYNRCLVSVGAIVGEMESPERTRMYSRGIVYGTPKQITADWLRDQIRLGRISTAWQGRQVMASLGPEQAGVVAPMVPGLRAAIVDEADAVLIDEGVVPLIIARSRREDDMAKAYAYACELANKLDEGPDYEMDLVHRRAEIKRRGSHRLKAMFEVIAANADGAIFKATRRGEELVRQALVAKHCYLHGQQYQIVEGKIVIVDEYTGRFLQDRQWEHGLHQAVEAKEKLEITADRETLARMSFQRFYRSYPFLCGMTGTAADATGEMERVYSRPVVVIPTNRPIARVHMPMRIFRSAREKWHAIVQSIETIYRKGRPILVGTRSIAASEMLSRMLAERELGHQVLNAKNDKEEASIIERAGEVGSITVATNMAGRGTDIRLTDAARKNGGLHVILTEMHGAKRIDRQFIGRAGRQGDPGSAQMFVALDDELVTKYAPSLAKWLRLHTQGEELPSTPWTRAVFRLAQRRNERKDRSNRAAVLRQDDWIDKNLPGVG
jgi:preprotein translocase subunit SecA